MRKSSDLTKFPSRAASFVEPMECLLVPSLPVVPQLALRDQTRRYRAIAVRTEQGVTLFPRNAKSLNKEFPNIAEPLGDLPPESVIMDDFGRPVFNLLQNFKAEAARMRYFVFDMVCHEGRDLTKLSLTERRQVLSRIVKGGDRIKIS